MNRYIRVRIGRQSQSCEIIGPGACPFCTKPITWADPPEGEKVAVELFDAADFYAEPHWLFCRPYGDHRLRSK